MYPLFNDHNTSKLALEISDHETFRSFIILGLEDKKKISILVQLLLVENFLLELRTKIHKKYTQEHVPCSCQVPESIAAGIEIFETTLSKSKLSFCNLFQATKETEEYLNCVKESLDYENFSYPESTLLCGLLVLNFSNREVLLGLLNQYRKRLDLKEKDLTVLQACFFHIFIGEAPDLFRKAFKEDFPDSYFSFGRITNADKNLENTVIKLLAAKKKFIDSLH